MRGAEAGREAPAAAGAATRETKARQQWRGLHPHCIRQVQPNVSVDWSIVNLGPLGHSRKTS